jgi:hypothetical protein
MLAGRKCENLQKKRKQSKKTGKSQTIEREKNRRGKSQEKNIEDIMRYGN